MIVSSSGDVGDCVYLLGILKDLPGGPHTLVLEPSPKTKAKDQEGVERLLSIIGPLASVQPYIKECRLAQSTEKVDWKSADFRANHYKNGETLMQAHANHLFKVKGINLPKLGVSPWISMAQCAPTEGRIIINRTGRYRNPFFKWSEVVKKYRHKLLFIGLHHEWREFCGHFGYVEYLPTSNMLDVAAALRGCEMFIGNQSCCNAVAEGLKKPIIQETSTIFPDCIWVRPGTQHVYDGRMVLPGFDGDVDTEVGAHDPVEQIGRMTTDLVPPGQWQFPGCGKSMSYDQLAMRVKALPEFNGKTKDEIRIAIMTHTIQRIPDWQSENKSSFFRVEAALQAHEDAAPVSNYHSLTGRSSL